MHIGCYTKTVSRCTVTSLRPHWSSTCLLISQEFCVELFLCFVTFVYASCFMLHLALSYCMILLLLTIATLGLLCDCHVTVVWPTRLSYHGCSLCVLSCAVPWFGAASKWNRNIKMHHRDAKVFWQGQNYKLTVIHTMSIDCLCRPFYIVAETLLTYAILSLCSWLTGWMRPFRLRGKWTSKSHCWVTSYRQPMWGLICCIYVPFEWFYWLRCHGSWDGTGLNATDSALDGIVMTTAEASLNSNLNYATTSFPLYCLPPLTELPWPKELWGPVCSDARAEGELPWGNWWLAVCVQPACLNVLQPLWGGLCWHGPHSLPAGTQTGQPISLCPDSEWVLAEGICMFVCVCVACCVCVVYACMHACLFVCCLCVCIHAHAYSNALLAYIHRCGARGCCTGSQRLPQHNPRSTRSQGHQLPEAQDVVSHFLLRHEVSECTLRTSPSWNYPGLLLHSSWTPNRPDVCAVTPYIARI